MMRSGDQGDGTYLNPVLCSDYSDPDVIAVGDDYYLTASSFNCIPGLPILHSKDLVNWSLIGHALDRLPMDCYDQPCYGRGVWAPSLRYHDGKFWIVFGTPDEGIFVTTATDPAGPWTDLHCMQPGKGLIDPCPFWDDDPSTGSGQGGQAYLVHALAASRAGVNSLLILRKMAPDGSRCLDEGVTIIDGHYHHPVVEGPKVYKRNGFYYIFAPAGGVKGGWQTVFRARDIAGPYEDRIVLYQGNTDINGPHQGGWIETACGEHWFMHFQDRGAAGRVVHLQPMTWEDDWPVMGIESAAPRVYEPVVQHAKPRCDVTVSVTRPPDSDDFMSEQLGLQWQWMANAQEGWLDLQPGRLRLTCQGTPSGQCNWWEAGNLLMQKPQDMHLRVTTEVKLQPQASGDHAGLILTSGICGALVLEKTEQGIRLILQTLQQNQVSPQEIVSLPWSQEQAVLSFELDHGKGQFYYRSENKDLVAVGEPICPHSAAWIGAKVGLFALNPGIVPSGGVADFTSFHVETLGRN